MKIKYLGHSCFQISSGSILVMDPYNQKIGELPKDLAADIVTVSHQHFDHNFTQGVSANPQIIDEPGEFSIKGFEIKGIKSFHDNEGGTIRGENIIFKINAEGITVCHLGDLGHILTAKQVNEIGKVDILMIPIGGFYTIDAPTAIQVVNQINPKIVFPMHFKPDGSNLQLPIEGIDRFTDRLGWKVVETTDEFAITNSDVGSINQEVIYYK